MPQVTLFGYQIDPKNPPKEGFPDEIDCHAKAFKPKISKAGGLGWHSEEYCINAILQDQYLWDMRCWNKDHDREEVLAWLQEDCHPNNAGHVKFCIRVLVLDHGWSLERVADVVLQNNKKAFAKCPVKCFHDVKACPWWKEGMNFGNMNCSERCDKT